jgi:branched-subunit amino acid transport protein
MKAWLVIMFGGLITFGIRFSFIYVFDRHEIPETIRRALRFVPAAVLSAIIFPELFIQANRFNMSFGNERLIAGLIAALVAWFSKNILLTLVSGMTALLVFQNVF